MALQSLNGGQLLSVCCTTRLWVFRQGKLKKILASVVLLASVCLFLELIVSAGSVVPVFSRKVAKQNQMQLWNRCDVYQVQTKVEYQVFPSTLGHDLIRPANPYDVTLVTQLQFNRIEALERLVRFWEGPVSVALYLKAEEVYNLTSYVKQSEVLQNKKNVAYHVVYRQGEYYPINLVRNVAMKEVKTPFLFMLDVDFVGPPDMYAKLKQQVARASNSTVPRALLVPTFFTNTTLYVIAPSKHELLRDLRSSRVKPYYASLQKFPFGHLYHDYPRWIVSSSPYEVEYAPLFEPYMVLPKDCPLYHEDLIERMMDKSIYTYEIYRAGYSFLVLDDVFIVHIPHARSQSHVWAADPRFQRCRRLFNEVLTATIDSKYRRSWKSLILSR